MSVFVFTAYPLMVAGDLQKNSYWPAFVLIETNFSTPLLSFCMCFFFGSVYFGRKSWSTHIFRPLAKRVYPKFIFLISQQKHMLWVLKRTVSMRRFFWAPKTYDKTDGQENIYNFTLNFFVYLRLCLLLLDIFQLHLTLRFVRQRRLTLDFI